MANSALLTVKIAVDAAEAQSGMTQAAQSTGKFQAGLSSMVGPATAVVASVAAIGAATLKAASDQQQALGGLDAVFGQNADVVKGWADNAATSVGLSKTQYSELAATLGAQFKNLGVPMDEIAGKTDGMIKMGADLAATYGGTTADAVAALGAAMRGEADPAERYGLALSQTAIKAKMAEDGTDKLTGAAGKQAKTAALLALATEQAGGAMGQFARESDSAAGASQIATAQWEDAKAALGEALLPAATAVAGALGNMANLMKENKGATMAIIGVVGGLAAAVLVLNAALSTYAAISGVVTAIQASQRAMTIASTVAQWLHNAAWYAFPVVWIIAAIAAVVVIFILLWKKCEGFRNVVIAMGKAIVSAWNWIKSAATSVAAAAVAAWARIIAGVKMVAAVVRTVANAIKAAFAAAWKYVGAMAKAYQNVVGGAMRAVANAARTVANTVRAVFRAGWASVKSAASSAAAGVRSALTRITSAARSVANSVKSVFTSAWNAVKSAASRAFSAVVSAVRKIVSPAASAAASFKRALTSAFNAVRSAASSLGSSVRNALSGITGTINRIKGSIASVKSAIASLNRMKVRSPPKAPKATPATASATGLRTASPVGVARPRASATTATGGVVVNVHGALDPEAVARQIRQILDSAATRRHGVRLVARTS